MFDIQSHVVSGETRRYSDTTFRSPAPELECADGFRISVQASCNHYCKPRNNEGPYSSFECGFPSERDDLLMEYIEDENNPTETVYARVPLEIVLAVLEKHGGVKVK